MLFRRKKKTNKLNEDLVKFDYDHLELLLKKYDNDRIINITLPDGTKLEIRPISESKKSSRFGRFE